MIICQVDVFSAPSVVTEIAQVYKEAFGGFPWDEGYLCPVCTNSYPLKTWYLICPLCMENGKLVNLIEYWPKSQILRDFYREMSKSGSICLVASDPNVIGLLWGYDMEVGPETCEYLSAPGIDQKISGSYFYIDECAVRPSHQGLGVGKILFEHIKKDLMGRKGLLRTKKNSRMQKITEAFGGVCVQEISADRVIMTLEF